MPSNDQKHIFFLGSLANLWGNIEQLIDHWVEAIHGNGGEDLIQPRLPPNLDRELDYLTEAVKVGLVPHNRRTEAREIIQDIHRIKGFRHTLIHSLLVDILPDGRVIVDHSRVKGSARVRARVTFKRAQMLRHYEKAFNLERTLRNFLTGEDIAETKG